jgi:predicted nucleotidyltransferase
MNKEQLLDSVSQALTELYGEYASHGMLAAYIWGSVLTSDFDIEKSDLDTLAVVEDSFALELEAMLQNKLALAHPDIKKIRLSLRV